MRRPTLEEIREKLWRFFRREKRLPSYAEMCRLFGFASKNAIFRLVPKLIEAGLVEKGPSGHLIPRQLNTAVKILGTIQAGFPTPEEEELLETVSLDDYLVRNPQTTYLLKVSGDSMIDEGIKPGDLVLVDRGRNAEDGYVVVAQIDGEWTLKFLEKKGKKVRLIAGNKKYPPLIPKRELTLGGVVVSVIRRYE